MLECSRRGAALSMYGLSQGCPCCAPEAAGADSVFDLDPAAAADLCRLCLLKLSELKPTLADAAQHVLCKTSA